MKRLSVLFVSMSVAVAATTSAPAQQLYESPDNAFYRYDANDGEGVAGPATIERCSTRWMAPGATEAAPTDGTAWRWGPAARAA